MKKIIRKITIIIVMICLLAALQTGLQNYVQAASAGTDLTVASTASKPESAAKKTASYTGLKKRNGHTYYYRNGVRQTGSKKIGGYWYYFHPKTGVMQTGLTFVADKNKICYFSKKGRMLTGTRKIRGVRYRFSKKNGAQILPAPDLVTFWKLAGKTSQIIVVSVGANGPWLTMHEKNSHGIWRQTVSTRAAVGRDGIGKTTEYNAKTPVGAFTFTRALGIQPDPGCRIPYKKINASHYWVSDVNASRYNRLVSTKTYTSFDKSRGEHLISYGSVYNYILAIGWNKKCVPGGGSAIFLHCTSTYAPTGGCVAVSETAMKRIMRRVKKDCRIVIDYEANLSKY